MLRAKSKGPGTLLLTRILLQRSANRYRCMGSLIPKGLRPPAQGCEPASYPGTRDGIVNLNLE